MTFAKDLKATLEKLSKVIGVTIEETVADEPEP